MADMREEILNIKPSEETDIFAGRDEKVKVHMHRHPLVRRAGSNFACPCILCNLFGIGKEDDR